MPVRTNSAAGNALTELNKTSRALSRSFERISSGLRISRASDDAAGLGVAENLRASSASAVVAGRNINDGMSIIAIAEGASNEVANILVRMRELAVQSASETLGGEERSYIQSEFASLSQEVDRISNVTEFNGIPLTNGTTASINVQVGIQNTTNDTISVSLGDYTTATLGVGVDSAMATGISLSTAAKAGTSLAAIDSALATLNDARATLGASENRLSSALNNIETYTETTTAAESRIRDADFGYETAQLSQNQILQQAGTSILGQAKNINQAALSLLQG